MTQTSRRSPTQSTTRGSSLPSPLSSHLTLPARLGPRTSHLLFLLFLFPCRIDPGNPGDSDWEALADLAGGDRQETAVVELDGKIYVIGGFTGGLEIVGEVEVYDPASDSWGVAASLPEPL